jgi:hypothetical protein
VGTYVYTVYTIKQYNNNNNNNNNINDDGDDEGWLNRTQSSGYKDLLGGEYCFWF